MRPHFTFSFSILLALLITSGAALATVTINGRTVATSKFRIVWNSGSDVEAITQLYWNGGTNLTGPYLPGSCNGGDVEYFGNAWAPPDPQVGGRVLVGSGTTGGTWLSSKSGGGGSSASIVINSSSTECAPTSAGVPVTTTYVFTDTVSDQNSFVVKRQFNFGNQPFTNNFRPYMSRLSLASGFTQVLYPAIGGVLASLDVSNCPNGCTGPYLYPQANPLPSEWDSSQQWYAMHNPATGEGVVVLRQRALNADGSIVQSQLWIDSDTASNTNSSSFLLMNPFVIKGQAMGFAAS